MKPTRFIDLRIVTQAPTKSRLLGHSCAQAPRVVCRPRAVSPGDTPEGRPDGAVRVRSRERIGLGKRRLSCDQRVGIEFPGDQPPLSTPTVTKVIWA